jgi:hypothetical protein
MAEFSPRPFRKNALQYALALLHTLISVDGDFLPHPSISFDILERMERGGKTLKVTPCFRRILTMDDSYSPVQFKVAYRNSDSTSLSEASAHVMVDPDAPHRGLFAVWAANGAKARALKHASMTEEMLIRFAVKMLSNPVTERFAPQVYVPCIHLLGPSMLNSPRSNSMRSEINKLRGKFGSQLAESERRNLIDHEEIRIGDVRLYYDKADTLWHFSQPEMDFAMLCEFAAYILRDLMTKAVDARYYVEFLVSRPESDWAGSSLINGANSVPSTTPESAEEKPAQQGLQQLDIIAVQFMDHSASEYDIAVVKQGDVYRFARLIEEIPAPNGAGMTHWGSTTEPVYFPRFRDLLDMVFTIIHQSSFRTVRLPLLADEAQRLQEWVPDPTGMLSAPRKKVRTRVIETLARLEAEYPQIQERLNRAHLLLAPRVGAITLREDALNGFYFSSLTGEANPEWSAEQLTKMLLLVLCDPATKGLAERSYMWQLALLISEWRKLTPEAGLDIPEPTVSSTTTEPAGPVSANDSAPIAPPQPTESNLETASPTSTAPPTLIPEIASDLPMPVPSPVPVQLLPVVVVQLTAISAAAFDFTTPIADLPETGDATIDDLLRTSQARFTAQALETLLPAA